jgi:hypothetical protein
MAFPVAPRRGRFAFITVVALTGGMLAASGGTGHAFQITQAQVVSADP